MSLRLVVSLLAAMLAAPAGAAASEGVEIGMEDERLLLGASWRAPAAVAAWRDLGVDVVRLHASWARIAPRGRKRPRGFRGGDHRSRRYHWGALDRAIRLVRANGMRVMLTVTGPGPVWTSRERPARRAAYKPDPRAFGAFSRAVATRYRDDVDRYLIWNEPNLTIAPRRECSGVPRRCFPVAPHIYRALAHAAGPAIEAADPGAEIVIGELAPLPLKGALGPPSFLREMACVTARYEPIRDGRCRNFRPVAADALGHHPHGRKRSPDSSNPNRDSVQMGNLSRLLAVADRLTRRGRIRSPRGRPLPLRLTELGYQTSPPDRFIGVSPARQARYLQKAAYLAWRNPRVKTITQYQWHDERIRRAGTGAKRFAGWQSGLHFFSGRPKPALAAFARPFVALEDRSRAGALLWGQVRRGTKHAIVLERRDPLSGEWLPRGTFTTDPTGVWAIRLGTRADAPGRYRFAVLSADGTRTGEVSGAVTVARPPARTPPRLVAARAPSR
jgi:hypothetical protein